MDKIKNFFNIKAFVFVFLSVCLLCISTNFMPKIGGDSSEYVFMAVSLHNHFTPDYRTEDMNYIAQNYSFIKNMDIVDSINFRTAVFKLNDFGEKILNGEDVSSITGQENNGSIQNYHGYYGISGKRIYDYHFWFYSLICSFFIPILKLLNVNLFYLGQIVNACLIILLFYWINFRTTGSKQQKFWLNLINLCGPMWYYFVWSCPELFIYTAIFIGLLEYREKRSLSACLWLALASLQNNALIFFLLFLIIEELVKNKFSKKLLMMCGISAIALIQFVFYFINFHTFNLIASSNYVDLSMISFHRALTLFTDLNFGMMMFIFPVFIILLILCFKRNIFTYKMLFCMLFFAIICSAQTNWNHGLHCINRYAYFMLPFALVASSELFKNSKKITIVLFSIIFILTSSLPCLWYETFNNDYLDFGRHTQLILSVKPSLYNPEPEVFIEKILHKEINVELAEDKNNIDKYLPIEFANPYTKNYKRLLRDEKTGKIYYLNSK